MTPGMTGNIDWSQPQQAPTPQTLQSQFMNMGSETMLGLGTGGGAVVGDSVGQENSDEYWNALIDGESTLSSRGSETNG